MVKISDNNGNYNYDGNNVTQNPERPPYKINNNQNSWIIFNPSESSTQPTWWKWPVGINNTNYTPPIFQNTNKSPTKKLTHEQIVDILAENWSKSYSKVENHLVAATKEEMKSFIEKLYSIAKKLNITKTNSGSYDPTYPSIEDQIVDELCGIFANESQFCRNAKSDSGTYNGVFQFSKVAMNSIKNNGSKLKYVTMDEFRKLPITQQLDYFEDYVKVCKDCSKLGTSAISPKQVYTMLKYPYHGKPRPTTGKPSAEDTKYNKIFKEKENVIKIKIKERGTINFNA